MVGWAIHRDDLVNVVSTLMYLRGPVVTKQKIEAREIRATMTQFAVFDLITVLPEDDEEEEGHTNWKNLVFGNGDRCVVRV